MPVEQIRNGPEMGRMVRTLDITRCVDARGKRSIRKVRDRTPSER